MIEIELPDGSIAEFPDGMPDAEIERVLQQQFAPQQTVAGGKDDRERSWSETGLDMLKGAGTGLVEGATSLAGLPRDAGQWLGEQATYGVGRLMGQSPEQIAAQQTQAAQAMDASPIAAPKSSQVMGAIENVTGPLPMPETTAGKYARTTGQMAAGALAGPGGVLRKAAMTVAPGVASEAAGQATEGTWAEPIARAAGAVAGGVAAAGRGNVGTRQMLQEAPTLETVGGMVDDAYKALDDAKIIFDQNAYKSTAMKIQNDLRKHGLLTEQGGEVSNFLNQIMARTKKINGWTEIDSIRKEVGKIAANGMPDMATEAARANIIKSHLDSLIENGKVMSLRGIKREDIAPMVANARELARREIIGKQIDEMGRKGKYYVSGTESGARNQFSSYLKSQKGKGLSRAEEKAFDAVTRREGPMNVAHMLASRFSLPTMGGGGWMVGGPAGAAAGLLGNMAFRKGMEISTKRAVDNAMKTVLAGKGAQATASARDRAARGARNARVGLAAQSGLLAQEPFLTDARGNQYPYSLLGVPSR